MENVNNFLVKKKTSVKNIVKNSLFINSNAFFAFENSNDRFYKM